MINFKNSSIIYLSQETGNDSYAGFLPHPDGCGNGPIKTVKRLEGMINHMRGSCYADEYYASDIQSCRDAHGSLQFENADTCSIENCSITCAGTYAIDIYKGCEFIRKCLKRWRSVTYDGKCLKKIVQVLYSKGAQ